MTKTKHLHQTYRGLELDRFQRQALHAIDAGRSVLVAAPTGTGKTLIADYLVDQVLGGGGRIVYTAPVKALGNQKFREYSRLFEPDQVGIVTGDVVIRRDAPLRVMTTEILRNILLQGVSALGEPDALGDIRAVILDELHFIDDRERGTVWEEVLIYLPDDVQILGLSATLSNLEELAGWLSAIRGGKVAVVKEEKRAVPLAFHLGNATGGISTVPDFIRERKAWFKKNGDQGGGGRSRRGKRQGRRGNKRGRGRGRDDGAEQTSHMDLVSMLGPEDLPALFFVFSRRATERCARQLARRRSNRFVTSKEARQIERILNTFNEENPNILQSFHRGMYRGGIAFHHAGLNVRLKELVEGLYEQRLIKVLYCTSTFALGINMPARTVLFDALEKYNGEAVVPLTVRQFMQKAGRAGRRGLDDVGQVVIKMEYQDYARAAPLIERLLSGEHEPVRSAFNLSFHSIVNLLERYDEEAIREMLDRSFLAHQLSGREGPLLEAIALQEARLRMVNVEIDRLDEGAPIPSKLRGQREKYGVKLEKLERRLERHRHKIWLSFQEKVQFLRHNGYIKEDGSFGAGARLLRHIQIEEVLVTELILAGLVEGLLPEEVFGLCTGLVNSLSRQVTVLAELPKALDKRVNAIVDILEGPIITRARDLAGGESTFDIDMMALGYLWAQGSSLDDLSHMVRSVTDVTGDLVGAFRRAKDLVGQIRLVYWEDVERRKALGDVIKKVTRDEVEAI